MEGGDDTCIFKNDNKRHLFCERLFRDKGGVPRQEFGSMVVPKLDEVLIDNSYYRSLGVDLAKHTRPLT